MYAWGDNRRFNSYSGYFRRMFGCRVQKLSVDAGFTCPNRDGTISGGGCTFCNNGAFTPSYCVPAKGVRRQVEEGIEFHRRRYRTASKYLVYFQSFSNTYAPLERLKEVYGEALAHPDVAGIVVGTRPDCVDAEKLDYFAELARGRYVAVEYGIESTRDETLRAVNRGHDFACARRAVEMTAARGLHVGAHFILGLPGETDAMLLEQVAAINSLPNTTPIPAASVSGRSASTSTFSSRCCAACGPIWSSSGSRARRRPATITAATGGWCATSNCWRCSKKDWRNEMRIKAKFLYLYSRCDRFGQAAPRQPANLFAIAPCLHYVLDRRRSGKMQVNLLLPSVCTIFAFAIANISVPK